MGRCGNMKKRIFIITILSIAMLTACNESGKTNDISKNGQDKKQAEKLEINTKKNSDKEDQYNSLTKKKIQRCVWNLKKIRS